MKDSEKELLEKKGIFTGTPSQVGQVFGIKISSGWTRGRFLGTHEYGGHVRNSFGFGLKRSRTLSRYEFVNMKTGKEVVIKSKQKIAGRIPEAENSATPSGGE